MEGSQSQFASIDAYISSFPADIQQLLRDIRATIRAAAPEAVESISYQMPAFTCCGPLVYFAAFKHHIGFYPAGSAMTDFDPELAAYKRSKGTIQFPYGQAIPLDLIRRITEFRLAENQRKLAAKKVKAKK